jgi:hypothetical protein
MDAAEAAESRKRGREAEEAMGSESQSFKRKQQCFLDGTKGVLLSTEGPCIVVDDGATVLINGGLWAAEIRRPSCRLILTREEVHDNTAERAEQVLEDHHNELEKRKDDVKELTKLREQRMELYDQV